MKRYSLLTLFLLTTLLPIFAAVGDVIYSANPKDSNLVFTVLNEESKTVSVKAKSISYYGADSILNIPASVMHRSSMVTYTVTKIDKLGFKGISIKQIILPESICEIDSAAFRDITTPFSLIMNEGLTKIGERAFVKSTGLYSLTIPSTVVEIGSAAFCDCNSLKKVILLPTQAPTLIIKPSDIGKYYNFPLEISINIPNKTYFIYVSAENWNSWKLIDSYLYVIDNLKYSINSITSAKLHGFDTDPESGIDLTIPDEITIDDYNGVSHKLNVTEMVDSCFCAKKIASVKLPMYLQEISFAGFRSNPTMTSITLNENLKVIKERAFTGNSSLTSITIPASVEEIGSACFTGCNGLTNVNMLPTIAPKLNIAPKDQNQYYIFPLTSNINLPERSYFNYATNEDWTTFRLKDSYTHIEGDLRFSISSLTEVTVDGFTTKPTKSPYNLVIPEKVTIIDLNDSPHEMGVTAIGVRAFRDNTIITSVTFNSNLKVIGERSFTNDNNISSLEIPASVTEIGAAAFSGCKNGLKVKMLSIVPPITTISNNFDSIFGIKPIIEIEVPCGNINEYSKALYWKDISNKLITRCKPQLKMSIGEALTKDTVVSSIAFSRTFPMNLWQELYLPFDVDSVLVLDEGEYYNINVPFDSTENAGYFYLYGLKNIDMTTGIISFQEVHKLEGFTPYLILFIDKYTDYFVGKDIVFKTKLGEYTLTNNYSAPNLTSSYQLHGNKSLWEQSLADGFTLSSSFENGEYKFHFDYNENAPIHPFSWVVTPTKDIASKIMPAPRFLAGRWGNQSSGGEVTTSMQNTLNNSLTYTQSGSLLTLHTQGQPCKVYAVDGTLLLSTDAAQDEVTIELNKGLYIVYSNGTSHKILF